jgi:hypothetical protein
VPRTVWRVTIDDDGGRRPIFAFGWTSIPGMMVDIGAYAPFDKYVVGVFDVPALEGAGIVATIDPTTRLDTASAPKVHYHPSGSLSADQTGRVERRGIQATPMDDLHGEHIASVVVADPYRFAYVPGTRATDMSFTVQGGMPPVVKFVLSICQLTDLDERLLEIPENPIPVPAQNTLTGRDTLIGKAEKHAVTVEVHPNPPEYPPTGHPMILVTAFDHAVMRATAAPAKMLLVRSSSADEVAASKTAAA